MASNSDTFTMSHQPQVVREIKIQFFDNGSLGIVGTDDPIGTLGAMTFALLHYFQHIGSGAGKEQSRILTPQKPS